MEKSRCDDRPGFLSCTVATDRPDMLGGMTIAAFVALHASTNEKTSEHIVDALLALRDLRIVCSTSDEYWPIEYWRLNLTELDDHYSS